MEINILGPFTAHDHGVSIVPSAAKPRQLLALLALHADRVVTVSTLMQELWGESIPRSAATTLQTYILQLRRKIAGSLIHDSSRQAKDVLETRHGAYVLHVQPGTLDFVEFDQLVESGRHATEAGDAHAASRLYGQALDLWRGPALVDVRVGSALELEVLRLEERRMSTLERRIEADLRIGRHAELIPELRVLAAQQPLHENFCAQLMLALHRAGNPWRALEAYQRLRGSLVRELGLEPSPKLQRIQQAVLTGRPVG
ncbi:AfsR/SARP family transcriptional regulator [Streptomyces sp. MP131-18]|uniref:AfsR/SARP family transcriptional regulator n=1 Tax=Streptomyces sp. MP131-18 TaxID=1857892 RepID=UPI00097BBEAC|nr:AfsR/SARP family transcriptional regulator [Streptomyces sp. MP131-18]ONK11255.1 Molybdopterin biosynthesis positive regulator [Streptomyces sp. MP131-18]